MILLYSTHPLMYTLLQGQSYRTPRRPVPKEERRKSTSTSSEVTRPFRPEKGYKVICIVDSGASDEDREESPPKRGNVPYDAVRARRDKLRRKAERKAKEAREQERRQEKMKLQSRRSLSPSRHTSQWDNWKPQEEEKKSPSRPADQSHRNSRDY
jgi:hypothetical protein